MTDECGFMARYEYCSRMYDSTQRSGRVNSYWLRESVRGPWDSNGERQERTNEDKNPETQDHHLRERIDQLAAREDRLSQNLGQYVQQQTRLTNIIEGIGEQLE